ncbi:hypothetical protein [Streptomyces avidinii]|uniref:Uncharacterized protein n=1 Tax=Streptomyces avidinii TaxID=1895 RepID=A0ABS4LDG2_STRAV|nr:hypothetical protein [Streptomyces avidinii]MBP2040165.1 hypothetical protein [Streptomyces avidinii]GGZ17776.1 hypothetical protein GCM10010343_51030 [Streptomyces avidinii]
MIGEPELDGEQWPAADRDGAPQDVVVREPLRSRARPWQWVAAAVVVTSALWAGGFYAFGDRPAAPEIRYRVTENLCDQFTAPALDEELGGLTKTEPRAGGRHPALDWASCHRENDRAVSLGTVHTSATVELHKKTDPAVEFALDVPGNRVFFAGGDGRWEPLPGIGEQAMVTNPVTDDSLRLRVRDGGAVFTVDVMIYRVTGGDDPDPTLAPLPHPGREALLAAAVEDTRALMAALRRS